MVHGKKAPEPGGFGGGAGEFVTGLGFREVSMDFSGLGFRFSGGDNHFNCKDICE